MDWRTRKVLAWAGSWTAFFVERLWRSLKYKCVGLHAWETGAEAKSGVKNGSSSTMTSARILLLAASHTLWSAG